MSPLTGYNSPIPGLDDRKEIKKKLVEGFQNIKGPNDGLVLFGSYGNIERTHEDSDIDAVAFRGDEDILTSAEWLFEFGKVISGALGEFKGVKIDVNVVDNGTAEDGRFCSIGGIMEEVWKGECYGNEFREGVKSLAWYIPEENQISFNLRKVRSGAVKSRHMIGCDQEDFYKSFRSALKAVSSLDYIMPRLVSIYGGDEREFRDFIEKNPIYKEFTDVRRSMEKKNALEHIVYSHGLPMVGRIDAYFFDAVKIYETVIAEFMKRYPTPGERVVKF